MMIWFCTKAAALEYGLDGMDLDVEDSGAGEDVQVDHGDGDGDADGDADGDGDGDGLVFFNTEKVSFKVAVIKETRRLLPNFHITYTIAATVFIKIL